MIEYEYEHERSLGTLRAAVTARLNDGWELAGGITACHDHDQGYVQAMSRRLENSLRYVVEDTHNYHYRAFCAERTRVSKEQREYRNNGATRVS